MSGGTNATFDEEFIKSTFYKSRQFVEDAFKQGAMSTQTAKKLSDHFLDLFFQQDPLATRIMEMACGLSKGPEDIEETVSPLEDGEKTLFTKTLKMWES